MKLEIVFEDSEVLVCVKPVGVESQVSRSFEPDMVSAIKNYLRGTGGEPYVGVIHRLDKPVGGILVYGKSRKAAGALSNQVKNNKMKKKYLAVLCGQLVDKSGRLVDYLWKEERGNVSRVVLEGTDGAKQARLSYRVIGERQVDGEWLSLVEVELETGRHHQIRVQFSHAGYPIWGDRRYNEVVVSEGKIGANVALFACGLGFHHPVTGKWMEFERMPKDGAFLNF